MAGSLDIASLYQAAFGGNRGKPFDATEVYKTIHAKSEPLDVEPLPDDGGVFAVSRNSIRTMLPNGQSVFMPVQIGDIIMPNEPSMSLMIKKNVVMTGLAGSGNRKGTVKELVSTDDWYITLRGIIFNYDSPTEYPEQEVYDLYKTFKINTSLKIESGLTNLLDIYRVVVLDLSFPEMIGSSHAQAYELKLVSDEDFDLEVS